LVLRLGPLSGSETTELLAELVGAEPDPELRRLGDRTAGNPRYLHELVVAGRDGDPPGSLTAAVTRRLRFLTPAVTEALQIGALLGVPVTVADVAAVLGRPAGDLALPIDEALTLGVLVRTAGRLAFRHAL